MQVIFFECVLEKLEYKTNMLIDKHWQQVIMTGTITAKLHYF